MLIDKGLNINLINNNGDTPIILLAKNGTKDNIRIIQKLIEYKPNLDIENNNKESFYSIINDEAIRENFKFESELLNNKNKSIDLFKFTEIAFLYFVVPFIFLFFANKLQISF